MNKLEVDKLFLAALLNRRLAGYTMLSSLAVLCNNLFSSISTMQPFSSVPNLEYGSYLHTASWSPRVLSAAHRPSAKPNASSWHAAPAPISLPLLNAARKRSLRQVVMSRTLPVRRGESRVQPVSFDVSLVTLMHFNLSLQVGSLSMPRSSLSAYQPINRYQYRNNHAMVATVPSPTSFTSFNPFCQM